MNEEIKVKRNGGSHKAIKMTTIYRIKKEKDDGSTKAIIEVELDHFTKKISLNSTNNKNRWDDAFIFQDSDPEVVNDVAELMISAYELAKKEL